MAEWGRKSARCLDRRGRCVVGAMVNRYLLGCVRSQRLLRSDTQQVHQAGWKLCAVLFRWMGRSNANSKRIAERINVGGLSERTIHALCCRISIGNRGLIGVCMKKEDSETDDSLAVLYLSLGYQQPYLMRCRAFSNAYDIRVRRVRDLLA